MLIGQLIFRDTGQPSNREGYKLMIVCGIISVPNNTQLKGEHQYIVAGSYVDDMSIKIYPESEINLIENLRGVTLDGMIKSPLWRV